MQLCDLEYGKIAKIVRINLPIPIKTRFFDIGLRENSSVTIIRQAPLKDPIEIKVNGIYLAIRKCDAKNVEVKTYE